MDYTTSREENPYSYARNLYDNCQSIYKKIVEKSRELLRNPFLGDYSEDSSEAYMRRLPPENLVTREYVVT